MTEFFPFAHLRVHSDYTLSRGASKPKDLAKYALKLGMPAMALVEEGVMYGAMEFSKAAAEMGLQPIVGVKLWLGVAEGVKGSIVLLAQNEDGYRNICTIMSMTHRPHDGKSGASSNVPLELLEGDLTGIIALTGGMDGCLRKLIEKGRANDAADLLTWLRSLFCERLYIEISRFGDESKDEIATEQQLIDLAYNAPRIVCGDGVEREGVPLIATTEIWYAEPGRHDSFEILKAVSEGKTQVSVTANGVVAKETRRYHMRSTQEMQEMFADIPEAFENACHLPRRIHFLVSGRAPILPPFETEGGRSEAEELRLQSWQGLEEKFGLLGIEGDARIPYKERLEFELNIIENMKFPGYFLIVSDFIKWAKRHDIPVGPGRGSGAGSLVAYSLKITNLDPLQFGLLFERFLNPERVSMPDFDVDFCQDRREEVIQYVVQKYGVDLVSLIATFGEIKAKTAISDVGRVVISEEHGGYVFPELKRITKLVSQEGAEVKTLAYSYKDESNPLFRQEIDSHPKYGVLLETAQKVEGLYRTTGSHAAGVIIGGQPLHTLTPMGWDDTKNLPVCQYNMKYSEMAGLVKFDFLGLKTLSVIQECLLNIRETTGEVIDLDLLSLDDAGTYEMLSKGFANGVFQLESEGMKRVLIDIKPTRIEDLIAVVSLYRPGPMEMIPLYASCKNGKTEPEYPEPVAETKLFLEETFGIMVYQEQVMLVAQKVAGYSLGGADLLRRAMGKKIPAEMAAQRKMFVDGAVEHGRDGKAAENLFDLIAKFAGYGFNKSHAAAYALISYHTAYLKHNYPAQFMSALLTYETDKPERMAKLKEDMDILRIEMLPPCVNHSFPRFKPERKPDGSLGVRFGFTAIKGISGTMEEFLKDRVKNGPFQSIEEYWGRAGSYFDKGQLEVLVEAGAFDVLGKNRNSNWSVLSFLAKGGKKAFAKQSMGDLFGGKLEIQVPHDVRNVAEWGNRVDRQFMAVGFYFSDHPMDPYLGKLMRVAVKRKASLKQWMADKGIESLQDKRLAGMVEQAERRQSNKTKKFYVWAKFAEKSDSFTSNFFHNDPNRIEEILEKLTDARLGRRPVVIVGKVVFDAERDDLTIWGNEVFDADELIADQRNNLQIVVDRDDVYPSPEENRFVRQAIEALRQEKGTQAEIAEAEMKTKSLAIRRKAGEIKTLLEGMRDDENGNAIPITIKLLMGEQKMTIALDGKYLIDMSAENSIKAMDGVVSVSEEVDTPRPLAA
jgi:DNA polymerase-3 subunit alpha